MKPVVVIGQMGVGKTTVGRLLAEALGRVFFDSDRQILELERETGREIAAREGVATLHELELEMLFSALRHGEDVVVAAAASVVDDPRGRNALRDPICLWIDREPSPLATGGHRRPLAPEESLERRRETFEEIADFTLSGIGGPEVYAARALLLVEPLIS